MLNVQKADLKKLLELHASGKLVGVFEIAGEDYHNAPGISTSSIKKFLESPKTYRHYQLHPEPPTSPMEFGQACHTLILEPKQFKSRYAIAPEELDRKGTNKWKEFEAENPGKLILKAMGSEGYDVMSEMANAARAHSRAALLEGLTELCFFWKHPKTGLLLKTKPDKITFKGVVVDYKTTTRAFPSRVWSSELYKRGYHIQGAMALDGIRHALAQAGQESLLPTIPDVFVLFAQEKKAPYLVKPWRLGESTIHLGRREYEKALEGIVECEKTGKWDGYPEKIEPVDAPEYAFEAEQAQWTEEEFEVGEEND